MHGNRAKLWEHEGIQRNSGDFMGNSWDLKAEIKEGVNYPHKLVLQTVQTFVSLCLLS